MIAQPVTVDDLRDALQNAETQAAELRAQQRELEDQLRGLLNAPLTDEQRAAEQQRLKAEYRGLAERQRVLEAWRGRLTGVLDAYERKIAKPRAELRKAEEQVTRLDEQLAALSQQVRQVQAEREVAVLRCDAAQASVDAVVVEMRGRPFYPAPARVVSQVGTPTKYYDAQNNEVASDESPLP